MSLILLGILNSQVTAGGLVVTYRFQTLGGTNDDLGLSGAVDSSGNAYAFGRTRSTGAGSNDFLLAKYDSTGTIQWQRVLGGTGNEDGYSVAIHSDENIYVFGRTTSTGAGGSDFLLAKYNSSGTIQWQRVLGGSNTEIGWSVAVDSSGNVYALGYTNSTGAGGIDFLLTKYDSSGTIQWQRVLGGASTEIGYSVAIDSSDNVYVSGYTDSTGAGGSDFLIAKYNSSGTIQWQRVLGGSNSEIAYSVAVDSSGNLYVLGYTDTTGAGGSDFLLAKYDSSGTIQWQRVLGGSNSDVGFSVAVDSAGNIYVAGSSNSRDLFVNDGAVAKYNSSGTIQWQRYITIRGQLRSLTLDSADNLYLSGVSRYEFGSQVDDMFLAVIPSDGSLTGNYTMNGESFNYQASSLTSATASLTASTSSLTSATASLTAATSSLTSSSASLTEYKVDL